jgi:hypothetical protein
MAEDSKFKCTSCGREFRWRADIAGKKAKCKCGATVQVPAADPGPAAAPKAAAAATPSRPPPPPAEESFYDVYALAAAEAEQAAATSQANEAPLNYAAPAAPPPPRTTFTPSGAPIPKRAKWDNTPSTFERWTQVWRGLGYALLGLLFCAYAYYEFWSLGARRRHRTWFLIWILYMIGGRWAVLVVIGGMGLLMVLVGILAVFGKANIESDD